MVKRLVKRLGAAVAVLFMVSLLTFCALHVVPGDTATLVLGTDATQEALDQLRASMGLDRSLPEQYFSWIYGVFTGDWGTSRTYSAPVWGVIASTLPVTLALAVYATVLALAAALVLGCVSALRPGGVVDVVSRTIMQLAGAVPGFWLAVLCMLFFAARLGWFPVSGYVPFASDPAGCVRSLTLPACVLACGELGVLIRTVRSCVMDALQQEYMLATQVKGLARARVVLVYVLRTSLSAPITVAGLQMAKLVGGTAAVERVFALPGLGNLLLVAVEQRDIMLVQGIVVFVTLAVVLVNLVVDLLTAGAASKAGVTGGSVARGTRVARELAGTRRCLVAGLALVCGGAGAFGGRCVGPPGVGRGHSVRRLRGHGVCALPSGVHARDRRPHGLPWRAARHGARACAGPGPQQRACGRGRVHGAGVRAPDLPDHARRGGGPVCEGGPHRRASPPAHPGAPRPAQHGPFAPHAAHGPHRLGHAARGLAELSGPGRAAAGGELGLHAV